MKTRISGLKDANGVQIIPSANIITPVVSGFYTPAATADDLDAAAAQVQNAGIQLGQQLKSLGVKSAQHVQFIGHSLGSLENAYAVDYLTKRGLWVDQFTILDRPFGLGFYSETGSITSPISVDADQAIFRSLLPLGNVHTVDNYFGSGDPFGPNSTGATFFGKAQAFNHEYPGQGHSGVHDSYFDTIPTSLSGNEICRFSDGGFLCSYIAGGQLPTQWDPFLPVTRPTSGTNLNDWLKFNCEEVLDTVKCSEGSPAYLWLPEFTPRAEDQYISFDFQWENNGDGDWLTLHLGDHELFSFSGTTPDGSEFLNSGLIPISQLFGETGQLLFTLNSVGDPNAIINIRNVQFFGIAAVPEPSSIILLAVGFLSLFGIRYRRHKLARSLSY